jgi:hypothetical protein
MSVDLRPGVMIAAPITVGASAFAALMSSELPTGGTESFLTLILPAGLIGMLLVAFGLLPLWCMFARLGASARMRFTLVAALLWLFPCGVLIAATGLHGQSDLRLAMAVVIPGLLLIGMFGALARTWRSSMPRLMRNDARRAPSAPEDRAA